MTVTIKEFEDKVLEVEEVVIIVRAPSGARIEAYDYARKASSSTSLTDWLQTRVHPKLGDEGYEVVVIDGSYNTKPHGRTRMDTIRDGYAK